MKLSEILSPAYPLLGVITADKTGLISRAAHWLAENRQSLEGLSYSVAIVMSVSVGLFQIRRSRKKK